MKYYSLERIDKTNADYRIIVGERSNGKTYAVLCKILENYVKKKKQGALIRRFDLDIRGYRADTLYNSIVENGVVDKLTKGKYNSVFHFRRRWYLCRVCNGERVDQDSTPFLYGFSITQMEHDKSTSYPNVTLIFFDEMITRKMYLPNEFTDFMNVLSTIIRLRDDVVIYMVGNTLNKHCPYFRNMGLRHIEQIKQGTIDEYAYGNSGLKVALEYCNEMGDKSKPSNKYFSFDNPHLDTIRSGGWELGLYPTAPCSIRPKDIIGKFFIDFDEHILQCDIIRKNQDNLIYEFIYVHEKTTEIKNPNKDIIFTINADARPNVISNVTKPIYDFHRKILKLFVKDKVFYQDNEVGELVRNYFSVCSQMAVIKERSA